MGWRDRIATSQPKPKAPTHPVTGNCEDIEDIEPRYTKKNSFFIAKSSQNSRPVIASSISSKPSVSASLHPVEPTEPKAPIPSGWLVAYRDQYGILRGGLDDRLHGTVQGCAWDGAAWMVILTDNQQLSLTAIRSIGRTNMAGKVVATWTVREHGYDGDKGQG